MPRAAAGVTRVCQVSHDRADPCPSSSNPRCPANPASTLARAAVWNDGDAPGPAARPPAPAPAATPRRRWRASPARRPPSAAPHPPTTAQQPRRHQATEQTQAFTSSQPQCTIRGNRNQKGWRKEGSGRPERAGVMEEVSSPELPAIRLRVSYPAIEPVLEILTPATDNNRITTRRNAPINTRAPTYRASNSGRRSTGNPGLRCPSRPIIVVLATSTLRTASSTHWTTASYNGSI